jgi:anti-anti-sigma factor
MNAEQTSPSPLRVGSWQIESTAVCIVVTGELDEGNVDLLRTSILDTRNRRRPRSIVLDLSALRFIDVAAARTLHNLHAALATDGCTLTVARAQEFVWWLLSTLGLDPLCAVPAGRRRQSEPGS